MKKWLTHFILAAARRRQSCGLGGAPVFKGETPTYSDEHIERCAKLYLDNPVIRQKGVLFVTFLAFPEEVMRAVAGGLVMPLPEGEEYYPLLDAQRAVRERLDDENARDIRAQIRDLDRMLEQRRLRISNGAVIEPLHHKFWPKRRGRIVAVEINAIEAGAP